MCCSRRFGPYRSPDLSNNVKAACLQIFIFKNHHLSLQFSSRLLMCLHQWDHEQQVRRWAVPAGTQDTSDWRPERLSVGVFFKGGIFALIMLVILQVSAFPGLLQTSGIYDLSDFYLLWGNFLLKGTEEVRWDVQQSCVIFGFVILVLHSEPIPPNQTIENVCVCVFCASASSTPGNVLLGNKLVNISNTLRIFLWVTTGN